MIEINKIYKMEALELLKQLDNESIDLILTDPPYFNKGTKPSYNRKGKKPVNTYMGEWDLFDDDKEYLEFLNSIIIECNRVLKDGGSIYIFCNDRYNSYLRHMLKNLGMEFKSTIVWHKYNSPPRFIMEAGFISSKELILFAYKQGKPTFNKPKEFKEMLDVWITPQTPSGERMGHPTQKSISLIKKIINISSNPNDIVLDMFCGSGTTAVACKKTNRNFICGDINEDYVKLSKSRINFTTLKQFCYTKTHNRNLKENSTEFSQISANAETSLNSDLYKINPKWS